MKQQRLTAFVESPVLRAAHAGSAYPAEIVPLRSVMQGYFEGAASTQQRVIGIAAPHISPQGGWQSYRAAYQELTPDLRDRTFVVLGTSHYGQPDMFGLTRKPFATPFGTTRVDSALVNELAAQPAALMAGLLPCGRALHRIPGGVPAGNFWSRHTRTSCSLRIVLERRPLRWPSGK